MTLLVLGLIVFLGIHSVRIFANDWRTRTIARIGANPWKGLYSIIAIAGFALICIGYGEARPAPVDLWAPPLWTRHLTALLVLPAFILLTAAYMPGTRIKALAGNHPMLAGTKLWAFAHLLSNGRLADVLLFGALLAWAVANFIACRRRDRATGAVARPGTLKGDVIAIVVGLAAYGVFAGWLHVALIGVRPY